MNNNNQNIDYSSRIKELKKIKFQVDELSLNSKNEFTTLFTNLSISLKMLIYLFEMHHEVISKDIKIVNQYIAAIFRMFDTDLTLLWR